jgi:hypothetical protein
LFVKLTNGETSAGVLPSEFSVKLNMKRKEELL